MTASRPHAKRRKAGRSPGARLTLPRVLQHGMSTQTDSSLTITWLQHFRTERVRGRLGLDLRLLSSSLAPGFKQKCMSSSATAGHHVWVSSCCCQIVHPVYTLPQTHHGRPYLLHAYTNDLTTSCMWRYVYKPYTFDIGYTY